LRLRQIALVAEDLEKARADVLALLGLGEAYADPGVGKYGLHNAVWPIGDTFLEVVSPTRGGTTAGRLLEKRGGDGGYMAIFQTGDLAGARARVAELGVRVVDQFDGEGVAFTHLHPKDTGGAIVSVDWMNPPERWAWGGPDWSGQVRTEVATAIVGAEVQGDDPERLSARWAEVLGLRRERSAEGWSVATDGGELRFIEAKDGRGEGLSAFTVAVRDVGAVQAVAAERGLRNGGEIMLCGTRLDLQPA
jgi:hypothetical protein